VPKSPHSGREKMPTLLPIERSVLSACVDRTDQLPDGQLGSPLENSVLDSMHERSSWISETQACPNNLCPA
jgi:hypothetical protein